MNTKDLHSKLEDLANEARRLVGQAVADEQAKTRRGLDQLWQRHSGDELAEVLADELHDLGRSVEDIRDSVDVAFGSRTESLLEDLTTYADQLGEPEFEQNPDASLRDSQRVHDVYYCEQAVDMTWEDVG